MEDGAALREALQPLPFDSEKQLEDVVCRYPELLLRADDAPLSFICQQIQMTSGIMDVMMIDGDGLPVAVEVKLGPNAQARREIVGQLVDYVSTLTEYTVDELDGLVGGRVSGVIDAASGDEAESKKIWQTVGANLRAGLARYVLVLDEIPPELGRIVRFLAMRSNLDIRLVQISRYVSSSGQTVYVPRNVVERSDSGTEKISSGGGTWQVLLEEVVDAYSRLPDARPLRGTALRYRQILPPAWPRVVHYEFQARASRVLVEIHLEAPKVRHLASLLQGWQAAPPSGFAHPLVWDPGWYGEGRVTVELPPGSSPDETAQAMADLIAATESAISEALRSV